MARKTTHKTTKLPGCGTKKVTKIGTSDKKTVTTRIKDHKGRLEMKTREGVLPSGGRYRSVLSRNGHRRTEVTSKGPKSKSITQITRSTDPGGINGYGEHSGPNVGQGVVRTGGSAKKPYVSERSTIARGAGRKALTSDTAHISVQTSVGKKAARISYGTRGKPLIKRKIKKA